MSKEQAAAFGAISDCIDGAERVMGGPKPRTIEARTQLSNARALLNAVIAYKSCNGFEDSIELLERLDAAIESCRGTVLRSDG